MSSRIFRVNFTLQQAGQAGDVQHNMSAIIFLLFYWEKIKSLNRSTKMLPKLPQPFSFVINFWWETKSQVFQRHILVQSL